MSKPKSLQTILDEAIEYGEQPSVTKQELLQHLASQRPKYSKRKRDAIPLESEEKHEPAVVVTCTRERLEILMLRVVSSLSSSSLTVTDGIDAKAWMDGLPEQFDVRLFDPSRTGNIDQYLIPILDLDAVARWTPKRKQTTLKTLSNVVISLRIPYKDGGYHRPMLCIKKEGVVSYLTGGANDAASANYRHWMNSFHLWIIEQARSLQAAAAAVTSTATNEPDS